MNVVEVSNLFKSYKVYNSKSQRLFESINPFSKKYHKQFHALKGVSFSLEKGTTLGIIGNNGSGKSTLLKIIAGGLNPSKGNINVSGRVVAMLELGTGLNQELTGRQNINFLFKLFNKDDEINSSHIEEIIAFAEINQFIDQPVKTYSSGMKARLGFSINIHMKPDILLIDEVLAVGDFYFQQKCYTKINLLKKEGVSFIIVMHNISAIAQQSDTVLWLEHGKAKGLGDPKVICDHYHKLESDRVKNKKEKSSSGIFGPEIETSLISKQNIIFNSKIGDEPQIFSGDNLELQYSIPNISKFLNISLIIYRSDGLTMGSFGTKYDGISLKEDDEGKISGSVLVKNIRLNIGIYCIVLAVHDSAQLLFRKRVFDFKVTTKRNRPEWGVVDFDYEWFTNNQNE